MGPLVPDTAEPVLTNTAPLSPMFAAFAEAMLIEPEAVPTPLPPLTMEMRPPVRLVESPALMRTIAPTPLPLDVPAARMTWPACSRDSPDCITNVPVFLLEDPVCRVTAPLSATVESALTMRTSPVTLPRLSPDLIVIMPPWP